MAAPLQGDSHDSVEADGNIPDGQGDSRDSANESKSTSSLPI